MELARRRLTANRGEPVNRKHCPPWPRRVCILAYVSNTDSASALTFTSICGVRLSLHQTAKRSLRTGGAPEDQPGRTGLTQTLWVETNSLQLSTRYRRGQSIAKLGGGRCQSNATGSTQLGARLDDPHNCFTCRTATLLYNQPHLSRHERLPERAYAL